MTTPDAILPFEAPQPAKSPQASKASKTPEASSGPDALKPQPRREWRLILRAPKAGELASAEIPAKLALSILERFIDDPHAPRGAAQLAHELSLSKSIRCRMMAAAASALRPEDAMRLAKDPCRLVREELARNLEALPQFAYANPKGFARYLLQDFNFAEQIGRQLGGDYVESLFVSLPEERQTEVELHVIRRRIAAAADALDAGLRASGRPERRALADYLAMVQDDEYGDGAVRAIRQMIPPKPPRPESEPDALPVERPFEWRELLPDPERFAIASPGGTVVEAPMDRTTDIARRIPSDFADFFKAMRRSPDPELRVIAAEHCRTAGEARELINDPEPDVRQALLENDDVIGELLHRARFELLGSDEALWANLLRSSQNDDLLRSITDACRAKDPEVAKAIRAKEKELDELYYSDDDDEDDDGFFFDDDDDFGGDDEDDDEGGEHGGAVTDDPAQQNARPMPPASVVLGL